MTLPLLAAANAVVKDEVNGGGPPITTSSYGQPTDGPSPSFSSDPVVALVQASIQAARNGVAIPADLKPPLLKLDQDIPDLGKCQYFQINHDRPLCPRGDPSGDKTLVLIGDSHARQWVPALDPLSQQLGYKAYYLIREGCPSSEVTPWLVHGGPSVNCANFQAWAREQVQQLHPDVVVLGSNANTRGFTSADGRLVGDVPTMAQMYRDGMEQEIDDRAPYTKRIVIIGDPPAVTKHPGRCLSAHGATLQKCLSPEDKDSLVFIDALRQAAAAKGVQFVETASWFCDHGVCPSVVGQYIAHRDRSHVSQSYAGYLTEELEQQLRLDDPSAAPWPADPSSTTPSASTTPTASGGQS
jgi:SGNH domain (fused to AT3 domains)